MNFNFNNRDQYLVQRAEWAVEYRTLSAEIRQARVAYREAQRVISRYPFPLRAMTDLQEKSSALHKLRRQATTALQQIADAKEEAQRQVLAQRREVAA